MRPLHALFREYEWVHMGIGILGNLSFFIGSIFFLFESLKNSGVWLFIGGSLGMLIGTVGRAIVRMETKAMRARRDHRAAHGQA